MSTPLSHAILAQVEGWLLTLAARVAHRYKLEAEDVFQEAAELVLRNARHYDPKKGTPTTWAAWQFRHALSRLHSGRCRELLTSDLTPGGRIEIAPTESCEASRSEEVRTIQALVERLPPREQAIIRKRFGFEEVQTLEAIGREQGVTSERVRQLEARALRLLRGWILRPKNDLPDEAVHAAVADEPVLLANHIRSGRISSE